MKLPLASLSRFYDASEMNFYCLLPSTQEKPRGGKKNRTHQEEQADLSKAGELATPWGSWSKLQKT
jgi:hypothetical protein